MTGFRWCQMNSVGEIVQLDWEYIELRAALHRKITVGKSLNIEFDQAAEGVIACLALAIREQVLRSKIPDPKQEPEKGEKNAGPNKD